MTSKVAVVGLWHLGCSITAAWSRLGLDVQAIEFDTQVARELESGRPPLFEPGLAEALAAGLARGTLTVSSDPTAVRGRRFVFLAYDTPVRDDDSSDLSPIWKAVEACGPHMAHGAILIISAQLPVGTARLIRERLKRFDESLEVIYSPENLRLGEAISCYLKPGHIVIGADASEAGNAVEALFAPMQARCFRMNLPSAELVKHCINSFLATSVTLANQWADIAGATGADFADIAAALRADPRIGERAYIAPGIGFSGGTLGRDLRVLDDVNRVALRGEAPLFGEIWEYNHGRVGVVARRASQILGGLGNARIGLLGMTYKPGTSTLRQSLPLAVVRNLLSEGAAVAAHDPKADWSEVVVPAGLEIAETPYQAAAGADLLILLTEWPEYRDLDFRRLAGAMRRPLLLDIKNFLRPKRHDLEASGLTLLPLVPTAQSSRS
jgi:UDPglucose 6-dehydrogenase